MRTFQKFLLFIGSFALAGPMFGQTNDDLATQIRKGEVSAIKKAADLQRRDLISALEAANQLSGWHNEPARYWSQQALAKLGVKKYWDEIVAQLVSPEKTEAYQEGTYQNKGADAVYFLRMDALRSLAYANNPAAVKYMAPFIYQSEWDEEELRQGTDSPKTPLGLLTIVAFSQMSIPGAPPPYSGLTPPPPVVATWQAWWEQHKDYYEKLEFGQPAPPWPGTNATSQPPSGPTAVNAAVKLATMNPAPTAQPVSPPGPSARSWLWWLVGGGVLVLAAAWFLGHHRR